MEEGAPGFESGQDKGKLVSFPVKLLAESFEVRAIIDEYDAKIASGVSGDEALRTEGLLEEFKAAVLQAEPEVEDYLQRSYEAFRLTQNKRGLIDPLSAESWRNRFRTIVDRVHGLTHDVL